MRENIDHWVRFFIPFLCSCVHACCSLNRYWEFNIRQWFVIEHLSPKAKVVEYKWRNSVRLITIPHSALIFSGGSQMRTWFGPSVNCSSVNVGFYSEPGLQWTGVGECINSSVTNDEKIQLLISLHILVWNNMTHIMTHMLRKVNDVQISLFVWVPLSVIFCEGWFWVYRFCAVGSYRFMAWCKIEELSFL